jgi:hypothetical protein
MYDLHVFIRGLVYDTGVLVNRGLVALQVAPASLQQVPVVLMRRCVDVSGVGPTVDQTSPLQSAAAGIAAN